MNDLSYEELKALHEKEQQRRINGGKAVFKKRGVEHFKLMNQKSVEARRKKKELLKNGKKLLQD